MSEQLQPILAIGHEPCRNEDGVCQDSTHEHFDFDEFFEDYRADQEDRYLEGA